MIDTSSSIQTERPRPKRPFGVWFLTFYLGLFTGVFPIIAACMLFFDDRAQAELEMPLFDFIITILIALSIIVCAVGTWRGNNLARIGFLVLVTFHYGMIAYNNYQLASSGLFDEYEQKSWARVFRSIFWIGISWWYFTSKRARPFFNREQLRKV